MMRKTPEPDGGVVLHILLSSVDFLFLGIQLEESIPFDTYSKYFSFKRKYIAIVRKSHFPSLLVLAQLLAFSLSQG